MSVVKRYAKLDEIGFVGFQDNRSKSEIKRDTKRTSDFIDAYKIRKKRGFVQKKVSKLSAAN
jgi:hypothetical protein